MRALLADFHSTDLWHVLEDAKRPYDVHVVKAACSAILTAADVERIETSSERCETVLHRVSGNHWVNMDSPSELAALMTARLPQAQPPQ